MAMRDKIFVLILILFLPMIGFGQSYISFNVQGVGIMDLKEFKINPDKMNWQNYSGSVEIDFMNNKIKLAGLTFAITEKMKTDSGYVFRCIDFSNNEGCKIAYSKDGNEQHITLLRNGLIMAYTSHF